MDGVAFASARELLDRLHRRELRAADLLERFVARIEKHDPRVNAVVTRDFERAREAAHAADRELDGGDRSGPDPEAIGAERPLLGLPMTVKDTFEVAGLRTTAGAPALAEHVPARSADAVERLVEAGAVLLGKTNTPLFAGDCQTYNALFGSTSNPWDPTRTPGGSSGGSAAALAAGMTPLELGSDIGGSIRNPAHFCGVFGHKPTWGIVSDRGHIPGPPGQLATTDLGVVGPLARTADDLALALDVLSGAGTDVGGDGGTRAASPRGFRLHLPAARVRRVADLRVGLWLDDPFSPVDREYRALLEEAAARLESAGARVDRTARPDVDFAASFRVYALLLHSVLSAGYPDVVVERLRELAATLDPDDASHTALLARGVTLPHRDWLAQDERRARIRAAWARFFRDVDVLLLPVHPTVAFPKDEGPDIPGRILQVDGAPRPYLDFLHWVSHASLAGLPATVAPVGRTAAGLPAGVQILGAAFDDRTTLRVAGWLEALLGGFVPPPGFED
jgi:amidase